MLKVWVEVKLRRYDVFDGLVDEIVNGFEVGLPDDGFSLDLLLGAGVAAPGDALRHDIEERRGKGDIVRAVVDEDGGGGAEGLFEGVFVVDDVDLDVISGEVRDGSEELADFEIGDSLGEAVAVDFDFGAECFGAKDVADAGMKIDVMKNFGVVERRDDIILVGFREGGVVGNAKNCIADVGVEMASLCDAAG